MKNPPVTESTTDALPTFLSNQDDAHAADGSESTATNAGTTTPDDGTGATDPAGTHDGTEAQPARDGSTNAKTRPGRSNRTRSEATDGASGGTASLMLGGVSLAGAIALALMPTGSAANLTRFGIEPTSLVVVGTVLVVGGLNRRRFGAMEQRLAATQGQDGDAAASLRENVQFLVESQHASNERPPAAGEELQHVLVALQRQDEKINNLTKAIKMYGKPLMEISGQGTEIAGSLAQTRAAFESGNDATQKAFARIESHLRAAGANKEIADLADIVLKVSTTLEAMQKKGNGAPSLEPLQQQVSRLEIGLAAIGQRLEDSELRKSLLRLEDSTQKARDDMQQLLRGENLQKATSQLQERLDKATGRLSEGLTQMRDGHLGGLESSVRELQREISGVATTVAQIQAAVKTGGRAVAAAPVAAAPAAPAAQAAPAAPTATPAPERTPATPAAPAADGAGTGYQTGTRSSTGKNVLGAIAKLKQMKN